MSSAFSAINTIQPLPRLPLDNPSIITPTSSFLGSILKFRSIPPLSSTSRTPSAALVRRQSSVVVAISDVVKERKLKSSSSTHLLRSAEKAHYAMRDPITALKKYMIENNLINEAELITIEKKIDEMMEEAVEFAEASPLPPWTQLLENVFADPKGFGIGPDGSYRSEDPQFTQGTAHV